MPVLLRSLAAALVLVLAPFAAAQDPPELFGENALGAVLPEEVGTFQRTGVEVSPFVDTRGWEHEEGATLTGSYEGEGGNALFVEVSHFRLPRHRSELSTASWAGLTDFGDAEEKQFREFLSYEQGDPPRIAVFVGETFEVDVYPSEGDVSVDDLYAVLEEVDLEALVALDDDYTQQVTQAAEPASEPTEEPTDILGTADCSALNDDVREKTLEMMGVDEFVPWIVFLEDDQAGSAEIDEDMVTFPKEGNAWLQCVSRNDILWAPLGAHSFLLRVKKMWELSDEVVFRTERSGFNDVMMQGRIEMEAGEGEE